MAKNATAAKAETAEATPAATETNGTEKVKRHRAKAPFSRSFGVTIKVHDELNDTKRNEFVKRILDSIYSLKDEKNAKGETLYDVHRSTRGEPNENLQTLLIAKDGYDWPESTNVERGIRLPKGPLADALRAYAEKHEITIEQAAEKFVAAMGTLPE